MQAKPHRVDAARIFAVRTGFPVVRADDAHRAAATVRRGAGERAGCRKGETCRVRVGGLLVPRPPGDAMHAIGLAAARMNTRANARAERAGFHAGRTGRLRPGGAFAAVSASVLIVAACAMQVPQDEFRQTEQRLEAARLVASLECATPHECDERWTHAREFIDHRSATPVSSVSATAIETGEPHQYGVVSLRAERSVTSAGVTIIRLKGICRGMYDTDGGPGLLYRECAQRLYDAALDFRRSVGGAQ